MFGVGLYGLDRGREVVGVNIVNNGAVDGRRGVTTSTQHKASLILFVPRL